MTYSFAREKSKLNHREKMYYTGGVLLLLYSILIYTYPSIHMLQKNYMKERVNAEIGRMLEEQNRLRLEYELIITNEEMEVIARRYGLSEPREGQIIYVKKER
ncbi:MAG: hypothetical protein OEY64_08290 [Nitrospinota bacterium]|nr:hypothetical protein [Nitrospinota bacterium]